MHKWTVPLRSRLAGLSLAPSREAEIIEELSLHLEERARELMFMGLTEAAAESKALDELAGPGALAERLRPLRQAHATELVTPGAPAHGIVTDLWQDLRYAIRMLRRQAGFTAAAILTLAIGIGANAAIFSLVNATLLRPLAVADRDRLVYVHNGPIGNVFSYPLYSALRDNATSFDGMIAWGGITASLNADGVTDLATGAIVTGNYFKLLGIRPAYGRLLTPADDVTPGAHPVVVLGYEFWRQRFGGRPEVINQKVLFNGQPFTIAGIAPREFTGAQAGVVRNIYVPMMMQAVMRPPRAGFSGDMNADLLKNPNNGWVFAVGRLKPAVTVEQAKSEVSTLINNAIRAVNPTARPRTAVIVPIDEGDPTERGQVRSVAWLLVSVAGAVLLIACANIANLLLSRASSRQREFAIRLAVGASRWRIVRQLLTESVVLSLAGGAAGLGVAAVVAQWFRSAPPPAGALPIVLDFTLDARVLAFTFALALITGLIFGLLPALNASRPGLVPALKDEAAILDSGGRRITLKQILVVTEVALALSLLIAAGLFARSLGAMRAVDTGLDVDRLISAPLNINLLKYTRAEGRQFYSDVVDRVSAIPGVEAAGVARVAIVNGGGRVVSLAIEGRENSDNQFRSDGSGSGGIDLNSSAANVVSPGFFTTLGIATVRGRTFSAQDIQDRPAVAVVNETIARVHFAGADPLGRRISFSGPTGPWMEVVGVVRDSTYSAVGERPVPVVYVPLGQNHETGVTLYVRTTVAPGSIATALRHEIQTLEPNLPVPGIQTMSETIGGSLYPARMGAWLISLLGGLALALSTIGIYGVLAFSISRRTREMGIRIALGAEASSLFGLVIRDGMLLVTIGAVLGLGIAALASRALAGFLFGVAAMDPLTLVTVTGVLAITALLACAIPARRAMRIDPIKALKFD